VNRSILGKQLARIIIITATAKLLDLFLTPEPKGSLPFVCTRGKVIVVGNQQETTIMESATNKRRRIDTVHVPRYTLPEDLFPSILSHWDVVTLVEKKRVCQDWKLLCTDAIDAKRTETTQKTFRTNQELKDVVKKYCGYYEDPILADTHGYSQVCSPEDAEEIATTYGWPINKWDVSNVQDFSHIFATNQGFNEDIGSWNVSNATSMIAMFFMAKAFNQDISSWDVSNVRKMLYMFVDTGSFNQDLSSWKWRDRDSDCSGLS
jgi:surface protein